MKQVKLLNVILPAIWILQFVAELLTGLMVWRLEMIPGKYMI